MDLFIYLVVVWKKAMNLQCLCLETNASIHSLLPYLVSSHYWSHYLECLHHHHPACCLPLDCCYGLLDAVSDFPLKRENSIAFNTSNRSKSPSS